MIRTAKGSLRSRAAAIVLAVLVTLGVAACGDSGGEEPAAEGSPSTTTAEDGAADDGGDGGGVAVEVLDEGDQPRSPLRFTFTEGSPFRVEMIMKMGLDIEFDGEAMPSTALPATRMVMAGTVDRVEGEEAAYSFRYEEVATVPDPAVDPQVVQAMETALAALNGVTGTATVTTRGATSGAAIDTSKIADPNIKTTLDSLTSQMSSLTVPFPVEAVGVGARWKGTTDVVINGITTQTVTTYELVERKGNTYKVELEQDVTSPPGDVEIPGMPAGSSAEIVSYDVSNTGFVSGSLDAVVPGISELRGGGTIAMKIRQGQEESDMKQRLTLELRLTNA